MSTESSGKGPSTPIKVQATGMSNHSDSVTVGALSEGVLGLVIESHPGTNGVWLTESEAREVADAILAALGSGS